MKDSRSVPNLGTQLVTIHKNDQGKCRVSARELYEKLGFDKSQWARWYRKNIVENQFAVEHEDYEEVFDIMSKTSGGRPSRDFYLTLDFAKKVCMLSRTERGERIREYFLECERLALHKENLPYHLQRYLANRSKIPYQYFSMINEITFRVIAPLEEKGFTLPENMLPDGSEGRMFCEWLRKEKGIDTSQFPTYCHNFLDGRQVQAKMYPKELWPDFVEHFHTVWLPERAEKYFQKRYPAALPLIRKFISETKQGELK
jgi:phage anti-repressor protein